MILAFICFFLIGHALVSFVVWDRYLLGLVPWLALLLARVLTLPGRLLKDAPGSNLLSRLFVLCMVSLTLSPMRDAAASRFPVGGDHGAYQGIGQVVSYLQAVPADTTLYHRWLGWHWRFYLWDSPYDLRAWTSPGDLASQAAARPAPGVMSSSPVGTVHRAPGAKRGWPALRESSVPSGTMAASPSSSIVSRRRRDARRFRPLCVALLIALGLFF
jgi:hypothetical protein